jgi:hypothetical protein
MEKLRNFNLDTKIIKGTRARIAVSFLVAAGGLIVTPQAEGGTSYVYAPTPQNEFNPNVLHEGDVKERDLPVTIPRREILAFEKQTPEPTPKPTPEPTPKPTPEPHWKLAVASFYGPDGFYGRRTACGLKLDEKLQGVASKTLPCGTPVTFEWNGMIRTFPVVDRGPYINGREFDLTGGACMSFQTDQYPQGRCFTGEIKYVIENQP